jgi:16S rRNA (adenine1518-N6/adenine1519-N6)-dimethyltransferase
VGRVPRPKKSLGQHFLIDTSILGRIAAALEPSASDVVVEIGAGSGSLTRVLAPLVKQVIAVEKDRELAEHLRSADFGLRNVEVVSGDILRLDWKQFNPQSTIRNLQWKITGNIPYYITTPIIEAALLQRPAMIVLLVQEEVADRVVASPGSKTYGALSVGVQVEALAEKLFVVKAGAFVPPPRVRSALLRLRPREHPLVDRRDDIRPFRAFVAACFSQRRKQLRHTMRSITGRSAAQVDGGLTALGIDPVVRAETLAPERFVGLWRWSH